MQPKNLAKLFLISQLFDVLSTYAALNHFGLNEENPLLGSILHFIEIEAVMVFKLAFSITLVFTYWLFTHSRRSLGLVFSLVSPAVFVVSMVNLFGIISQLHLYRIINL